MSDQHPNYSDVEMKVEVTNVCREGRCKFCSPLFRPTVEEAGTEAFLERLDRHLESYLRGGGRKILLTGGGEPVDAPAKLYGALRIINRKLPECGVTLDLLTVYSNGVSLLKPIASGSAETHLDRLAELGVRDINLSVHGGTPADRTGISGTAMGEIDFEKLIPEIVRRGIRVMTRTTLANGYMDSVPKMEEFVHWMASLGVGIAYFSDLFTVPIRNKETTPGSQTVLGWTDEHRIPFDVLLAEVLRADAFTLVSEFTRHNRQGRTYEFRHRASAIRVMLGDLVIGNEAEDGPTYAYVKPDGSMGAHNNARDPEARKYLSPERLKAHLPIYRPGRDDL